MNLINIMVNIYEIVSNIDKQNKKKAFNLKSPIERFGLPNDWKILIDSNTNREYYICKSSKHVQWLHPGIPLGTMMSNGIPYGWEMRVDSDNNIYYINHIGKYTTRILPFKNYNFV